MVTGIESNPLTSPTDGPSIQGQTLVLSQHVLLTAVMLKDRTDAFNELVQEQRWMLHPCEKLTVAGNLFVFENVLDQTGQIAVKLGPLPQWRGVQSQWDIHVAANDKDGYIATLNDADPYPWQIIDYTGGKLGRTRALHHAQKQHMLCHELNFLSNTWGDRSQDSRMNEAFILQEIEAAKKLGVEVVQLDDGWQAGRTSNSAQASQTGGVWEGFHDGESDFWVPDPERFPNGLEPILEAAKDAGVAVGLWYAPDSANGFANWQQDVKTVLRLHTKYNIRHFKFDSINTRTRDGEVNLYKFFDEVLKASDGKIVVDLDITSGCRPGYFGRIDCGPLFVCNRYTDWHNYWPHHALRNLWQLVNWIEPSRIRMMLLNHARNTDNYVNDQLAPANISPATMFAPLMFCMPLGWFELSNLPESYFKQIKPLVDLWKQHRDQIHAGTIIPIGNEPDGVQWSGLLSLADDGKSGYLLICNGMKTSVNLSKDLPANIKLTDTQHLHGMGRLECEDGLAQVTHMPPQSYWFGTFTCA
jgi:alpha-galactosidase